MLKFVEVNSDLIGKTIAGINFESDLLIVAFDNGEYISLETEYDSSKFLQSSLFSPIELSCGVKAGVLTQSEMDAIIEQRRLDEIRRNEARAADLQDRELKELARLLAKYPDKLLDWTVNSVRERRADRVDNVL